MQKESVRSSSALSQGDPSRRGESKFDVLSLQNAANILQYVGGFKGEYSKAPSGVNQTMKMDILSKEGVKFDKDGMLLDKSRLWDGFKVGS